MCKFTGKLDGKDLFNEVKKVLNTFTASGRSFTKYEVTQEVRKNVGDDLEVLHSDVRLEVENLMPTAFNNYVSYHDGSVSALRYAPAGTKAKVGGVSTGKVVSTPTGPQQVATLPAAMQPLPISGGPQFTKVLTSNKKGLCLSKDLVAAAKQLTLHPGRVYVDIKSGFGAGFASTYQPDQYGNATVLNTTLAQVYGKVNPGDKYQVSVRLGTVEVTKL